MLPLRARVDLGAMAMKGCSAFPKTSSECLVSYSVWGWESYFSAEQQSVYSTASPDWATMDGTLVGITILVQSGTGSNGNDWVTLNSLVFQNWILLVWLCFITYQPLMDI